MTLFQIRWGWKAAGEPLMSGAEWMVVSVLIVLDVLLFSVIALIPAAIVAFIYLRFRSQT